MQDPFRAVLDSVFAAPAYQWQELADPFAFLRRWASYLIERIVRWGEAHPGAMKLVFWILLAVLVLLLVRALFSFVRGFRATPETAPSRTALIRDASWYRREAERLAQAGRLPEAMQADFTAMVLELDRDRLVRYHPSKTPQEYVREARLAEPARAELRDLVWGLYRHLFAREPVSDAAAAAWRARTSSARYAPAR